VASDAGDQGLRFDLEQPSALSNRAGCAHPLALPASTARTPTGGGRSDGN